MSNENSMPLTQLESNLPQKLPLNVKVRWKRQSIDFVWNAKVILKTKKTGSMLNQEMILKYDFNPNLEVFRGTCVANSWTIFFQFSWFFYSISSDWTFACWKSQPVIPAGTCFRSIITWTDRCQRYSHRTPSPCTCVRSTSSGEPSAWNSFCPVSGSGSWPMQGCWRVSLSSLPCCIAVKSLALRWNTLCSRSSTTSTLRWVLLPRRSLFCWLEKAAFWIALWTACTVKIRDTQLKSFTY